MKIRLVRSIFIVTICVVLSLVSNGQVLTIDSAFLLRSGIEPEWDEFKGRPARKSLAITFPTRKKAEYALSLVQYDVKQDWDVIINDQKIGSLVTDGNKMRVYFKIPAGYLTLSENRLRIQPALSPADDIEISEISIFETSVDALLSQAVIKLSIVDRKSKRDIPSRITIVDRGNILQSSGTKATNRTAVRPGFIYTGNGRANILLPAGSYTVYAGRGFEYNVDSFTVTLQPGEQVQKTLSIYQEVNTSGWINADTHIHTLTNSGHGDAANDERALTIAGEGIELPIITEHNHLSNFAPVTAKMNVSQHYLPIMGTEVTTPVGHFNVFPLTKTDSLPDHRISKWDQLSAQIPRKQETVVILNHGRDIHNGYRPFDQNNYIPVAGQRLDNWLMPANAMEIVNSGALLNEPMSIIFDWFGQMNRGVSLAPIGSSDSHDVSRYLVGQARTYVRTGNDRVKKLDEAAIVKSIRRGQVSVSFGLLPKVLVNNTSGPGDLAGISEKTIVDMEVLGPSWVKASKVTLYANGIEVFHEDIHETVSSPGLKWIGKWQLPKPGHDIFLVAIALGPGRNLPYWPIVKPFQPVSSSWNPYVIGVSGAVKIDADGDGRFTSAYEYASKLVSRNRADLTKLFKELASYDEAIAIQAASILFENGVQLRSGEIHALVKDAATQIQTGFRKYIAQLDN